MKISRHCLWAVLAVAPSLWTCRTQGPEPYAPQATPRERVLIEGPWRFVASDTLTGAEAAARDDRGWEEVRVPHTWAVRDPRTHTHAWYRTRFSVPWQDPRQRVYLVFEGVATIADVYVNGRHLGQHRGAFTRFVFDATDAVIAGRENLLAVRVNNDPKATADCLPSGTGKELYHIHGGIYRKVWLLKTPATHIDLTDHAAPGVYVVPGRADVERAEFTVRVLARNDDAVGHALEVRSHLCDREGRQVAVGGAKETLAAGSRREVTHAGALARPRLWSPADPYLYDLNVELWAESRLVDRVSQKIGFRDFRLRDRSFLLNGAPILLRGVGKHQETETALSALRDADLEEDFRVLKDLGVNMVRLAHYPHADLAYELADRHGILVWAENGNSNPGEPSSTGDLITREMVRQNFNHPSIVIWAVGNESKYMGVGRYAAIVRAEDASRLVTYAADAADSGLKPKARRQLDFVSHNLYPGWYKEEAWDFLAQATTAGFVSETGGGAVVTHHSNYGREKRTVDVFETEEYRQLLAEAQFQIVFRKRPQDVPMYVVWVLRDFGVPGMRKYKGVNTKGLLTRGDLPKDAYHLYRSFLRPETPTVHIASQTYFLRRGSPANAVKVYSNRQRLTLSVNGTSAGARDNGAYAHANGEAIANVFLWSEPLRPGRNVVVASDGEGHSDSAVFFFVPALAPNVPGALDALVRDLVSSNPRNPAYFIDAPIREQWPFYDEFDGTADNTFARLPREIESARWITTRRMSKRESQTRIEFTIAPASRGADVWMAIPATQTPPNAWLRAGFHESGLSGEWRDTDLRREKFTLLTQSVGAGGRVRIGAATLDYVILVKERPALAAAGAQRSR